MAQAWDVHKSCFRGRRGQTSLEQVRLLYGEEARGIERISREWAPYTYVYMYLFLSFTCTLAKQSGEQGIRVDAVAPSPYWTPLQPAGGQPHEKLVDFCAQTPLGQTGP